MNRDQVLAELRHHRQEIERRFAMKHLEQQERETAIIHPLL